MTSVCKEKGNGSSSCPGAQSLSTNGHRCTINLIWAETRARGAVQCQIKQQHRFMDFDTLAKNSSGNSKENEAMLSVLEFGINGI